MLTYIHISIYLFEVSTLYTYMNKYIHACIIYIEKERERERERERKRERERETERKRARERKRKRERERKRKRKREREDLRGAIWSPREEGPRSGSLPPADPGVLTGSYLLD